MKNGYIPEFFEDLIPESAFIAYYHKRERIEELDSFSYLLLRKLLTTIQNYPLKNKKILRKRTFSFNFD